ncbi:MAG: hypothetical protein EON89_09260 [Brevundimonas sp.]|nr:MAG: hypothetical protein EON89_09260 [Brevundimonas sp.]
MTKTALIACAALFASTAAAPVSAGEASRTRASDSNARIVVSLCERDALTQAAFRRNFGPNPVFVTADRVLSAQAAGERWSEPRCMSAGEHRRLAQLTRN